MTIVFIHEDIIYRKAHLVRQDVVGEPERRAVEVEVDGALFWVSR